MDLNIMEVLSDANTLRDFIKDWNDSRLDMFALSAPNENLEFSGVMRFYFQDRGQKAVTKCIRVNSRQTVGDIMSTLIEKFCPDMKMLSTPNYELYEIHGTGDVHKLSLKEKPLLSQLQWHNDDREGRFVLKSADLRIQPIKFFDLNPDEGQLKRRLSRREKKDLKKQRKAEIAKRNKSADKLLAHHIYNELPESSLTRTKSNPEAVMRRRRQQKLEKRMKEFTSKGGPQTGGILKIFAESLKPEIPYKTILASVKDNADVVTKAALEKFLLPKEDPGNYCIVMAILPLGDPSAPGNITKERIIRSIDCPLAIQNSWPKSKGVITFHLRRREPGTEQPKNDNKKISERSKSTSNVPTKKFQQETPRDYSSSELPSDTASFDLDTLPYFIELTPEGKEINYKPKIYYIRPHETVIGSSRNPTPGVQYLQLFSPKILASHCSIVNADGTVSIVPHGPDADVRVSGKRIFDTTMLHTGKVVQFGGLHTFRFLNPLEELPDRNSIISDGGESIASTNSYQYPPYRSPRGHSNAGVSSPPISPELKELILSEQGTNVDDEEVVETTFGVDGEIETNKTTKQQISAAISAENLLDFEHTQFRNSFRHKRNQSLPDLLSTQENYEENLLPASLTFLDHGKDAFFAAIINGVNGAAVNFKLAPTYTLYLAARYVLTSAYRPGLSSQDRSRILSSITKRIANSVQQTIQENDSLAGGLAFWMANASELLHFYRQDSDISPLTMTAQAILAQSIQESFALLVNAMEEELALALPAFLEQSDSVDIHPSDLDDILNDDLLERAESMELLNWTSDADEHFYRVDANGRPISGEWITPAARIRLHGTPIMADVLYILSSAMSLLRRCRVNAALTIQLFSQLFHFINMWTFNRIVLEPGMRLCTQLWGHRLRMRLSFIEAWAERQGLELAADCHLARIVQTAHLLEAPKDSADDIADIASACFKLNSLQLRYLLENYLPEMDEPLIPQELIDSIVAVAKSTSDELTLNDGREVKLEEDFQLQLPFLLPEEGYSSDIIRGVPPGLQEFLEPLCETGLCDLNLNPHSLGLWTVYQEQLQDEIDHSRDSMIDDDIIQEIVIDKGRSGLGLSICAAKGTQSDFYGIYVKAVLPGGVADQDGRIEPGDQIMKVNESSLIDVTQDQAAKIMGKSGPVIALEIMKRAAFLHGLTKLVQEEDVIHKRQKSSESVGHGSNHRSSVTGRQLYQPVQQDDHHNSYSAQPVQQDDHRNSYNAQPVQQDDYRNSYNAQAVQQDDYRNSYNAQPVQQDDYRNGYNAQPHTELPSYQDKPMVDGFGERIEDEREEPVHTKEEYHESDYDSDGNLIDAEEKARRKRQRQRQIEYEERLAKWEEERKRQEELVRLQQEEEKRQQAEEWAREEERQLEEEAEERYEQEARDEANRRQAEINARQEAERIRMETERKRQEHEQKRRDDERRRQERERSRREEEEKLAEEGRLREEREAELKMRAETERLRKENEERERRLEEEWRLEEERRLAEERISHEEERKRKDEERRRYEEERRRYEEERRRKEEQRKREEEQRKREEEEELWRQEEQRKRKEEEVRRQGEERKRREEEARRKEEERRRREEEEMRRRDEYLAEQRRRRGEEERLAEEKRRQEKQHLIEERRRKEEARLKQEEEERTSRELKAEAERKERNHRESLEKKTVDMRISSGPSEEHTSGSELRREMDSIDDALREAERIAAEMDLFMMEEEQKIEESVKEKREREQKAWKDEAEAYNKDINQNDSSRHGFDSKTQVHETDLDALDFLPPPPDNLLSDYDRTFNKPVRQETNIDSSDGNISPRSGNLRKGSSRSSVFEQQNWIKEQKDKREKQKQEQERLREERALREQQRTFELREASVREIENKKRLENQQMSEYRRLREQKERDEAEKRLNQKLPPVKPKNFKFRSELSSTGGLTDNLREEYKQRGDVESDRRRRDLDHMPQYRSSVTSSRNSSDEEDAPPRPPPPRNVPSSPLSPSTKVRSNFNYTASNGYSNNERPTSGISVSINSQTGHNYRPVKRTPEPAVVNQGFGDPEVLDFKAKMKLFGKN